MGFFNAPYLAGEGLGIILLSLKVALVAVLVSLPFATAIAYWLARKEFIGKSLVSALVHLPLVLPPVVTGYFLLIVFGRRGAGGKVMEAVFGGGIAFHWTGAALAAAVMAFPLLVRPIRLAFEAVPPELGEAAETLGAGRWRIFATVTLPIAFPGVIAGSVLAFAKALGEFGATITFVSNIPSETQTLSLAIYSLLQSPSGDRMALTLITASVALSVAAVVISEILVSAQARKARA